MIFFSLQHALENELQKKSSGGSGDGLTPAGQKAYIDTLAQTLAASPAKSHSPARADDVVRKSEVCSSRSCLDVVNLQLDFKRM